MTKVYLDSLLTEIFTVVASWRSIFHIFRRNNFLQWMADGTFWV